MITFRKVIVAGRGCLAQADPTAFKKKRSCPLLPTMPAGGGAARGPKARARRKSAAASKGTAAHAASSAGPPPRKPRLDTRRAGGHASHEDELAYLGDENYLLRMQLGKLQLSLETLSTAADDRERRDSRSPRRDGAALAAALRAAHRARDTEAGRGAELEAALSASRAQLAAVQVRRARPRSRAAPPRIARPMLTRVPHRSASATSFGRAATSYRSRWTSTASAPGCAPCAPLAVHGHGAGGR